ncbi:MAG: hypothetical protein HWD92_07530 [Flavobacteriia bacterium]|nr:hypothetical protein [Flavobacteriia bacterium]
MEHKSRLYIRYFLATILIGLALLSLVKAMTVHWSFSVLSLSLLFGLVFIRFKSISVNSTEFTYTDKSMLPIWNEKRIIPLMSIKSVEIFEAQVDKPFILIDILSFTSFYRGNTHPFTVVLKLSNGDSFSFVRFDKKKSFRRFVETLSQTLTQR